MLFFDMVIEEHKKGNSVTKDFVDILLQLQEGGNINFELTQETIKALLLDMFVAGIDTSATTLEWAFAELLKNPVSLKKAQEELPKSGDLDMNENYGITVNKKVPLYVEAIPYSFGSNP
ncbi:hypothetical protein L6164_023791 [Bauhinia variegata]|uniref:Uncharacterized protein n=1 Tax=Bauhinia variegata TaxID=167791 RepID=A0ACB9MJ97_BAUVA|nr:hypothetical protein L6164_023791 [Bauhinia variegata]